MLSARSTPFAWRCSVSSWARRPLRASASTADHRACRDRLPSGRSSSTGPQVYLRLAAGSSTGLGLRIQPHRSLLQLRWILPCVHNGGLLIKPGSKSPKMWGVRGAIMLRNRVVRYPRHPSARSQRWMILVPRGREQTPDGRGPCRLTLWRYDRTLGGSGDRPSRTPLSPTTRCSSSRRVHPQGLHRIGRGLTPHSPTDGGRAACIRRACSGVPSVTASPDLGGHGHAAMDRARYLIVCSSHVVASKWVSGEVAPTACSGAARRDAARPGPSDVGVVRG